MSLCLYLAVVTSASRIENRSPGDRSPWAGILVVTCTLCDLAKGHLIGANHLSRRAERVRKMDSVSDGIDAAAYKGRPFRDVNGQGGEG